MKPLFFGWFVIFLIGTLLLAATPARSQKDSVTTTPQVEQPYAAPGTANSPLPPPTLSNPEGVPNLSPSAPPALSGNGLSNPGVFGNPGGSGVPSPQTGPQGFTSTSP